MAQHASYWSCSPFADRLRGTDKPRAATMEEWDAWYITAEAAHPIRYWIVEEGLGKIQDFVTLPKRKIRSVKNYVTNRFVSKTHALTSTLKKGQYYEYEHRLLHCVMQSLVDYVEVEEAWLQVSWGDEKEKYKSTHRFWWNEWRCPQAGIDRLAWAASLVLDENMGVEKDSPDYGKPTAQAIGAIEISDLYTWWTVTRPARPDPYEASGWSAHNAAIAARVGDCIEGKLNGRRLRGARTKEEKKESSRLFEVANEIEATYEKEDDQMLIRLINLRKRMWT